MSYIYCPYIKAMCERTSTSCRVQTNTDLLNPEWTDCLAWKTHQVYINDNSQIPIKTIVGCTFETEQRMISYYHAKASQAFDEEINNTEPEGLTINI